MFIALSFPSTPTEVKRSALLFTSLYPENDVVEILVWIQIITMITESILYLFYNHPCTIMLKMNPVPHIPIVPDIPDVDVPILCMADNFNWSERFI